MATQKIEYQNKVAIDDVGVPEKNKITADNMNEIKEVVNNNADNADETTAAINSRIDTANNAINNIVENTYTKTETNEKLAQKADISDIPTDLSQLSNATTKFVNETQLQEETTARENADNDLQGQIDAIVAASDVVDIVGTYQELENYDTSHLGDNDIIKVLQDSTHNNATSYYRWKKHTSIWQYIGSEGPYYTKSESNEKFVEKETGKGLSTNDFTNAYRDKLDGIESGAEVNIIEKVKLNGTELPISNKEINIPVDDTLNNTSANPIQNKKVFKALEVKEDSSNKTDTLNPESTSTQYPNAEVVYNALVEKQNQIDELQEENNKLKADHPDIEEEGTDLSINGTGDFELALSPKGNIEQETTSISGGDEYDSPSPEHPSPVKVIDGEYEVEVENKNLFADTPKNGVTNYQTGIYNENPTRLTSTNWTFLKAGTYTINAKNNASKTLQISNITFDKNNNFYEISNVSGQWKNLPFTITLPQDTNWKYNIEFSDGSTIQTTQVSDIQLEYGSTATPYTEHAEQTQTIDTSPNPLYSQNDYYYKQNGNWYVHNEWGKVVLNGTENWITASSSPTGTKRFYYENEDVYNQGVGWTNKIYTYSDKFKSLTWNDIYADDTTTLNAIANFNNSVGSTGRISIRIEESYASTSNDFKTWLSTHNTTVIYKLATPTNTPITNTTLINQLEALQNMLAYQDQTNISQTHNEAQADMIINAQTIMSMRYLQNEIEELKQAILNS